MKKITLTLLLLITALVAAQPGTLNVTFNPIGTGANGNVLASALQSDGKIIIGGQFTDYNGTPKNRIARLNADGTLDTSFLAACNALVSTITIQTDGKIIIGGNFITVNGSTGNNRIARLNTDGTLDGSFTTGLGASGDVQSTALQADGRIIIAGDFASYDGAARIDVARLNADGTIDNSFNPGLGSNTAITTVKLQPNNKIIIGGSFTSYNGTTRNRIARLNADGTLDNSFDSSTGANAIVRAFSIQSDGKIVIGGNFTNYKGTSRNRIARLNSDGTLDNSFNPNPGADNNVYSITINSVGKIIIAGEFTAVKGTAISRIAILKTDGTLDATFTPGSGANGTIRTTTLQPDGRLIIGGAFTAYNGTTKNRIARIHTEESQIIVNMDTPNFYLQPTIATHLRAFPYTYPGVKQYRFSIKNNLSGVTQEVTLPNQYVGIPSNMLNYNASYDIKAAAVVNGEIYPYNGNTITVFSPDVDLVKLQSTSCGQTLSTLGTTISSTWGLNAISYKFRARLSSDNGLNPTYYYTTALPNVYTSMNAFSGLVPQYDESYAISVSFEYSGVVTPTNIQTQYGDECLVKMPSIPTIALSAPLCGSTLSTKGQTIVAAHATYAIQYQFKVRETSNPTYFESTPSASAYSNLMSFSGFTPADGTSYAVSVRYSLMVAGVPTWTPYGAECVIMTPAAPILRATKVEFTAVAYPNPFTNSFLLDVKSSNTATVEITVYDMLGRLVEQKQANANELETTTIGSNYPAGIYNVVIAQDTDTKTVRVIKR